MVESDANGVKLRVNNDDQMKLHGMLPIPAHLDTQIDFMAIQYMLQQMVHIDTRLKKAIFVKENSHNWYEVYLTSFILLCGLETVHRRQTEIVRRFESSEVRGSRESRTRNISPISARRFNLIRALQYSERSNLVKARSDQMLADWQKPAVVILYHWRAILRGQLRFTTPWTAVERDRLRQNHKLDDDSVHGVNQLNDLIQQRKAELEQAASIELENKKAQPLAWLSHMWMDDYRGTPQLAPAVVR